MGTHKEVELMNVYLGLFATSFSALSLQVALVRLLSVTAWYHLAFFAISTAMLGMTAGATRVYLRPKAFGPGNLGRALSASCIHLALSIPMTLLLLCLIPLGLSASVMSLFALLISTAACALPFFFVGTVTSAVLTKHDLPIGRLYASDLLGASLGCLFVLGGLEILDAPSVILLCSCTSGVASLCFAWKQPSGRARRSALAVVVFFGLAAIVNSLDARGVRPMIMKGHWVAPAHYDLLERWNSFSRVGVSGARYRTPDYWGPSPIAPTAPVWYHRMTIDGGAGTTLCRFNSVADIDHLRYDVTNAAYHLGRKGRACVIGVGGGRDVHSAILFGQEHVTGVEINPIFVKLLTKDFRDFAGLAGRPDVTLVTDEARSYLSRSQEKYSVIQMSLTDTWAATGAGAFSLSENSLYTLEAWHLFLDRLEENGVFTVSRWHSPEHIGESGRAITLAVAALLRYGVQEPARHLALITEENVSTLLVARQPFTRADVEKMERVCEQLRFRAVVLPDRPPPDSFFRDIVSARTPEDLSAAIAGAELDCRPTTDENPYFFNMLRLSKMAQAFSKPTGVVRGNLIATLTLVGLLLALLVLTLATIVLPLLLRTHFGVHSNSGVRTLRSGALYFSLIGAGFMLTEIALIQRLTVLLSHPLYALGILLFTLIGSTGIGSLLSDRLPLTRPPWLYVYPVVTAGCIIGVRFLLSVLLAAMVASPLAARIAASVGLVFPLGLLMGVFFPTGMRLAKAVSPVETPWFWALNGTFGVLCSALAVLISIYAGISVNFYIAAACYLAVLVAQVALCRSDGQSR
jgi:hypothetical protein